MKLTSQPRFWLLTGLLGLDTLFFTVTDPSEVASPLLIIGFLLFSASLYWLLRGLMTLFRWYGVPVGQHSHRLTLILTGVTGGLVAMQSIGQLSRRDSLVLLPLATLAYLYITYRPAVRD